MRQLLRLRHIYGVRLWGLLHPLHENWVYPSEVLHIALLVVFMITYHLFDTLLLTLLQLFCRGKTWPGVGRSFRIPPTISVFRLPLPQWVQHSARLWTSICPFNVKRCSSCQVVQQRAPTVSVSGITMYLSTGNVYTRRVG